MIGWISTSAVETATADAAASRRVPQRGVLLGVVAAGTYAVGPVLMKAALDSMSVWTLLVWRLVVATGLLWALLAARRGLRETPRTAAGLLAPLALGAIAYGGQILLFALALERVSASLATILFHTAPIVVVAAAVMSRREQLTPLRAAALVLGVGGVAIVAAASGDLRAEPLGIALSLGSAVACAAVVVGIDVVGTRTAPLPLAVLLITGSTLALLAAVPFTGVGMPAGDGWLLVLGLGIVPGVIGTVALLAAIGEIGPSLASILLTLEPPVTVLLAWLALDERLSALQLAGGGVILAAMVVANRAASRPPLEVPPA
jgi:drug/metabolite transporter (DMT)-like permease